jgi:hypothetical protein
MKNLTPLNFKITNMKTLIFIFLTFFALTANAQTADVNTTNNNTQATTADLMISIPMMGNINIKDCDEKLQEDLKPVTIMKVIKVEEAIFFYTEEQESIIAASFQEEKEIALPLQ